MGKFVSRCMGRAATWGTSSSRSTLFSPSTLSSLAGRGEVVTELGLVLCQLSGVDGGSLLLSSVSCVSSTNVTDHD